MCECECEWKCSEEELTERRREDKSGKDSIVRIDRKTVKRQNRRYVDGKTLLGGKGAGVAVK